ncbi:DNA polymerase III subunit delta' [Nesterenkonia sp. AN1]|uniref:DNA polymerase-3 subunit delta n=1 Tax=Nesterenkonia aurantiaca TaxID=1436010 RepID=A0A4R7G502_9MICC|nr:MULTISPECIES: DNA polymerase III subunit delta' [Nesterenkonia]EXF24279.1 DNA polymerase III subunit delta' [Nesterenkonia sp. AN1]TDS86363.1 DNA polymerase-3 subunit delta' [Nesterenkonia aurantiaca]
MSVYTELVGQDAVVEQLRRAAGSGTPAHAWLFTGPPGSGRSNAARAFAAALNCEQPEPAARGCGECRSCRLVAAQSHPSVKLVSTENVTYKIEDVRALITTAQEKPQGARWRVIVVEDADRMTERATNVLLKAIEEPPPHTLWVLCAPSPADVLVTIRSRCRLVSLRIPPTAAVAQLLSTRDGLNEEQAHFAARVSQNHIGVARRLARDPEARRRREQVVTLPLRLTSSSAAIKAAGSLVEMTQADAASTAAARLEAEQASLRRSLGLDAEEKIPPKLRSQFKKLEEENTRRAKRAVADSLDRALIDLTAVFRDVLSLKLGTGAELINEHLREELQRYAESLSAEQTLAGLDAINAARVRITQNVPPLLAMEALMMQFLPGRSRA